MQDNNLLSICKYLLKEPPKRFTLVHIEPTILPELRQWFLDTFNDPRQGQQEQQNLNEATYVVELPPSTQQDPSQGEQEQENLNEEIGNREVQPHSGPTHTSTPVQSRQEPPTATTRQQMSFLHPNYVSTLAGVARSIQGSPRVNGEGIGIDTAMDIDTVMNINDPIPNPQTPNPIQATSSAAAHSVHDSPTANVESMDIDTDVNPLHTQTSTQQAPQPVLHRTDYLGQILAEYEAMAEALDRQFEEDNRSP